jgi:hypothetical protein
VVRSAFYARIFIRSICFLSLALSGCANGYITTLIQTGVGLDVSENPQTQVPHIRFGYIRSQYYYVPTLLSADGNSVSTPDLVSTIKVQSTFLSSTLICERFAIGPDAVNSIGGAAAFGVSSDTTKEDNTLCN